MTDYNIATYGTPEKPSWCPGCGDFGILNSLKKSLAALQIPPEEVMLVSGIGCGSLIPYWVNVYGVCTLHGRALPFAQGAHLARPDLTMIVNMGDGDGLGIGMGHFAHFWRRNMNMTVICDNNGVYGLTKGQTAPTANKGMKTSSTPFGAIEDAVNGPALALMMGATFVARAYSADAIGLTRMMQMAIEHQGAAYIDILQPCVTFNKQETYEFYNERVQKNELDIPLYETREEAIAGAMTVQEGIPLGVLYREQAPVYTDSLAQYDSVESMAMASSVPASGVQADWYLEERR